MLFNKLDEGKYTQDNDTYFQIYKKIIDDFERVILLDTVIEKLERELKINLLQLIQTILIGYCHEENIPENILNIHNLLQIINSTNWNSTSSKLNSNLNKTSLNHECSNLKKPEFKADFHADSIPIKKDNNKNNNIL